MNRSPGFSISKRSVWRAPRGVPADHRCILHICSRVSLSPRKSSFVVAACALAAWICSASSSHVSSSDTVCTYYSSMYVLIVPYSIHMCGAVRVHVGVCWDRAGRDPVRHDDFVGKRK